MIQWRWKNNGLVIAMKICLRFINNYLKNNRYNDE